MPSGNNEKLAKSATLGLFLCWIATAVALAGGVVTIVGSFDVNVGQTRLLIRFNELYVPEYASRTGALSYFAFSYALWRLSAFLRLSRAGQVFAADTTAHLRAFGRWLLIAATAAAVLPLLAMAIHQFAFLPPGARYVPPIRMPLFNGIFVIAVATLVMTISRVIDEGRRFREELEEIV
ncbi:DUF2975 domain-containing protein [Sphingomonas sanxanigenens]|uniref:DUF2975 domain-containing protein n=1 Tax=Sphingomonas sanxanigenens TaxID=397260 RepID=UPI000A076E2A|nr:DUF2975 domain-containing protein [Sphingomonas sanxanigenens]